jgi:hypothetical protein
LRKIADAELIVLAVNSHNALVDQLAATADMLRSACLVIKDDEARAMALLQVRAAKTLVDGCRALTSAMGTK